MKNLLSRWRGIMMAPDYLGGGGGADDGLDALFAELGGDEGLTGGDLNPEPQVPENQQFVLSDEQLDNLVERLTARMQPQRGQPELQRGSEGEGDNEFLTQFAQQVRGMVLDELAPFMSATTSEAVNGLNLPTEVTTQLRSMMTNMSGAEALNLRKTGGDVLLAKALLADMVLSGKWTPQQQGNVGERGEGGLPSNVPAHIAKFIEEFKGFNGGRMPTADDARRWGINLQGAVLNGR